MKTNIIIVTVAYFLWLLGQNIFGGQREPPPRGVPWVTQKVLSHVQVIHFLTSKQPNIKTYTTTLYLTLFNESLDT